MIIRVGAGGILLQKDSTRRYFEGDRTLVFLGCDGNYMVMRLIWNHYRTMLEKVNFTVCKFLKILWVLI